MNTLRQTGHARTGTSTHVEGTSRIITDSSRARYIARAWNSVRAALLITASGNSL